MREEGRVRVGYEDANWLYYPIEISIEGDVASHSHIDSDQLFIYITAEVENMKKVKIGKSVPIK